MSPTSYALLATTFVSLLTFPLGLIFLKKSSFKTWLENNFMSLCAGVMLGNAMLNLLPEAFSSQADPKQISSYVLLGILSFFVLEKTSLWFHHHHTGHGAEPTTALILIGDGLHNFVDGIAIAIAFLTDFNLGIITTFAIIIHEIPNELSDLSILINKGMKISRAVFFNFLSAVTSVLGTIFGIIFFFKDNQIQFPLLAITAGMFIYIACSDLIPEIHTHEDRRRSFKPIVIFLLGIALIFMTSFIFPE